MPIPTKGMATRNQPNMFLMPTRVQLRFNGICTQAAQRKSRAAEMLAARLQLKCSLRVLITWPTVLSFVSPIQRWTFHKHREGGPRITSFASN